MADYSDLLSLEKKPKRYPEQQKEKETHQEEVQADTVTPRYHDTMTPTNHDTDTPTMTAIHRGTNHDTDTPTSQPLHRETSQPTFIPESEEEYIEPIRKAVKQVGKEGGTYRFTLEEKTAMKQIKRHYEDQGIDTSDIEIIRIGLNYISEDFRKQGEESILAKVMKRLHE